MMALQDRLTLEALLSDPLTLAVMRSDGISVADTARVFSQAKLAMACNDDSPACRVRQPDLR